MTLQSPHEDEDDGAEKSVLYDSTESPHEEDEDDGAEELSAGDGVCCGRQALEPRQLPQLQQRQRNMTQVWHHEEHVTQHLNSNSTMKNTSRST